MIRLGARVAPISYRPDRRAFLVHAGGGVALSAVSFVAIVYWIGDPVSSVTATALHLLALGLCVIGLVSVVSIAGRELTIGPATVEQRSLFRATRRVSRAAIAGYRRRIHLTGTSLLISVGARPDAMVIPLYYHVDATFDAWLAGLPDLDNADREARRLKLLNRTSAGNTPEERRRERRVTVAMLSVLLPSIAIFLWTYFYPEPYELSILACALVPVVWALAVHTPPFRQMEATPRYAWVPMLVSGVVLQVRMDDINWVDFVYFFQPVAIGSVVCALAFGAWRSRFVDEVLLWLVFAGVYTTGVVGAANVLLDDRELSRETARLADKYLLANRRFHNVSHYVVLVPDGPVGSERTLSIPRAAYREIGLGDRVCITWHPGAAGIRWFDVRPWADCGRQRAMGDRS